MHTKNLLNKRYTVPPVLFIVLFLLSWCIFAFNLDNADYRNYEAAYMMIGAGGVDSYFEIGFSGMVHIANLLGMSYQTFMIAIATISHLMLYVCIRDMLEYKKSIGFVWLSYILYPFLFDVVQYRFLLGFLICFWGLRFLCSDNKNLVKYIITVFVASLFHGSTIVYLVFLLMILPERKLKKVVLVSFVIMVVVCTQMKYLVMLLELIGLTRYVRYDMSVTFSTFIQYFALWLFFFILIGKKYRWDFQNKYLRLTFIVALLVPLSFLGGTAARMFRNALLISYCGTLDRRKRSLWDLAVLVGVLLVAIVQLGSGYALNSVTIPVITENALWGGNTW